VVLCFHLDRSVFRRRAQLRPLVVELDRYRSGHSRQEVAGAHVLALVGDFLRDYVGSGSGELTN